MASTLKEFAEIQRDMYHDLEVKAQAALAQATQDLANAQKDYDDTLVEYVDLERAIADKREAMDTALMPADMEAIAATLRDLILQLRKKRLELFAAKETLAGVQRARVLAETQLKRARQDLSKAEAHLTLESARADRHDEWKQKLADGDLNVLANTATALLDAASNPADPEDDVPVKNIKAATLRITEDIPEDLRARSSERRAQTEGLLAAHQGLVEDVEDVQGEHQQAVDGPAGLVALRWIAFERAEAAFRDFVVRADSRYGQALSLFEAIVASTELTQAEKDRIIEVSLKDGDEEALEKEQERDQAQADVDALEMAIELAIIAALKNDIDADPESDPLVQQRRQDLVDPTNILATKESDYTQTMRDNLDLWESAVPDHIWANLVAYDQAIALLTALKDGDPAALSAAMANTESALVQALEADKTDRTKDYLADKLESLRQGLEFMREGHQQRLLSAARGDN